MLLNVIIIFALQFSQGVFSENCETDNGGCSQLCSNTTDSFHCHCNEGYSLEADNRTCVDVDECRIFGACSQICENEEGGFNCTCIQGYISDPLNTTRCKSTERDVSLLLYRSFHISRLYLDDSQLMSEIVPRCSIGLDFHFKTGMMFWRDVDGGIFKTPVNRGRSTPVGNLTMKDGFWAVDWIHDHIYWLNSTDRGEHTIKVTDFQGSMEKILYEDLDVRSAIALDPINGWMFWINDRHGKEIERAGMDGSHRRTIIPSTKLVNPSALTIDLILVRLFWADGGRRMIFNSYYDGSNVLGVVAYPRGVHNIRSITIFEDWIYFTEREGVFKANKFTGDVDDEPVVPTRDYYFSTHSVVHIYHQNKQPDVKSYCKDANCSHLCLPAPAIDRESPKISCACPEGLILGNDKITCVDEKDGRVALAPQNRISMKECTCTEEMLFSGKLMNSSSSTEGMLFSEKLMNSSSSTSSTEGMLFSEKLMNSSSSP